MNISKGKKRQVYSIRSPKREMKKIENCINPNIKKVGIHKFQDGSETAIFAVADYKALNQLIGYAKFLNTDYGDVYYRGEVHLHNSVLPSISRKPNSYKYEETLNRAIKAALGDERFAKTAKLNTIKNSTNAAFIMEAMLQHYGYSTHFVDVVDNHWVALWFGLNQYEIIKNIEEYASYKKRYVKPIELLDAEREIDKQIYQYMLLIAVDNNMAPVERGIYIGNDMITIDLRSSMPSIFLRPHAQHGLVIRKNIHASNQSFDIAPNVVAIIRLRIDHVAAWIGDGYLLSTSNLFPSVAYDQGYEILQQRNDLFNCEHQKIVQYVN